MVISWGAAEQGDEASFRLVCAYVAEILESQCEVADEDRARLVALLDRFSGGMTLRDTTERRGRKRKGDAKVRGGALETLRAKNIETKVDLDREIRALAKKAGVTVETMRTDISAQLDREASLPSWPAPVIPRPSYEELREKYPDMGHAFWVWASRLT